MQLVKWMGAILVSGLLIAATAVVTAGTKLRFGDGASRVFSGGPLESGALYAGPEPDWSMVDDISTIELQLFDPPLSRRLWTVQHDGKLYVWSGYMGSLVGRLWKRWPGQAETDGRAMVRINGVRYERHLIRLQSGPGLDDIAAAVANKYPSSLSRASIEAGDVWLFEAAPPRS